MNASVPVIRIDASSYYALQNGVWFVATSPAGPWAVATSVPSVIYTIPVSSPLHYVTYAYVYGATPEVVYTGYTPGYLGTVVAPGPVVVYGTGYVYPAWVGTVWYPAPVTWGWSPFAVGFGIDVLTGFAFGFALGPYWGWHHGWGWHGGGWGWHHGIAHVNVYNRWGDHVYLSRHLAGDIGRDIGRDVRRDIGGRRFGGADVYAGCDGHVYRRDGVGHLQEFNRDRGWASVRGPTTEHEQWHLLERSGRLPLGADLWLVGGHLREPVAARRALGGTRRGAHRGPAGPRGSGRAAGSVPAGGTRRPTPRRPAVTRQSTVVSISWFGPCGSPLYQPSHTPNGLMQRTIWRGHRAGLVQRWHEICSRKWSRARRGCGQQSARALRWLRSHTRA